MTPIWLKKKEKTREAETGHFTETGDDAQAWTMKTDKLDEA
jgi:hypothetical protein